jgi:hypothetical protein
LSWKEDPYESDVNGDYRHRWMCQSCEKEALADI